MKNKILILLVAISISLSFNSCKDDVSTLMPVITGKPGEVVLIINDALMDGPIGEEFQNILKSPQVALPQPEPRFDITTLPPSAFSDLVRTQRNLIMTKVGSDVEKPEIIIKKGVWAKQQLVINILAPTQEEFLKLLKEKGEFIVETINDAEKDRIIGTYQKLMDKTIESKLMKNHELSLIVPKGFIYYSDTANFVWIKRTDPRDVRQGILIYYYDYTHPDAFTLDYMLDQRDRFLKKYLPGPKEGTYMTTERRTKTYFYEYLTDKKYTAELRGRWKLVGDFMGGPFVSVSRVDEKRQRVVTVEAYVYAPNFDKREYLRQVESILHTLRFPE